MTPTPHKFWCSGGDIMTADGETAKPLAPRYAEELYEFYAYSALNAELEGDLTGARFLARNALALVDAITEASRWRSSSIPAGAMR